MIRTKSIYSERSEDDGARVLVTRYWPRGVRKEAIDRWYRGLGPAPGLIRLWKSGELDWERFRKEYLDEYESPDKSALLEELKDFIKGAGEGAGRRMGKGSKGGSAAARAGRDVTLLCTCRMDERCHRDILKELLGR